MSLYIIRLTAPRYIPLTFKKLNSLTQYNTVIHTSTFTAMQQYYTALNISYTYNEEKSLCTGHLWHSCDLVSNGGSPLSSIGMPYRETKITNMLYS